MVIFCFGSVESGPNVAIFTAFIICAQVQSYMLTTDKCNVVLFLAKTLLMSVLRCANMGKNENGTLTRAKIH